MRLCLEGILEKSLGHNKLSRASIILWPMDTQCSLHQAEEAVVSHWMVLAILTEEHLTTTSHVCKVFSGTAQELGLKVCFTTYLPFLWFLDVTVGQDS